MGLRPGVSPDSAAADLNRSAFGYRAYSSRAIASESSQTFLVVSRFHRAIAVITIVASAVFLLCIMLLKVEERRLDAAVMRFVGVRRRTIFGALLLEAALLPPSDRLPDRAWPISPALPPTPTTADFSIPVSPFP